MPQLARLPWDANPPHQPEIDYFSSSTQLVVAVLHQQLTKLCHVAVQTILVKPPVRLLYIY